MAQIDPIWKFSQLLDRLVRNDKRIIDCLTAIARDYPQLTPHLVEKLESRLYSAQEGFRKLLFLYVVDSLSFNVPAMRDFLGMRVAHFFNHSFHMADPMVKRDMDKLLQVWESQIRFPQEVLEDMREKMAPAPPLISSPMHTGSGMFDLGEVGDWLGHHSYTPKELLLQATQDEYSSLFDRILTKERSNAEREKLEMRLAVIDPRETHRRLLYELYDELPRQCLNCGLRFGLDSELDLHLDWHFQQNVRKRGPKAWLPDGESWCDPKVQFGLVQEETQIEVYEEQLSWAPCNPDQLYCQVCGEAFEIVPFENAWFCKDAARVWVSDQSREVTLHMPCIMGIVQNSHTAKPSEEAFLEEGTKVQ